MDYHQDKCKDGYNMKLEDIMAQRLAQNTDYIGRGQQNFGRGVMSVVHDERNKLKNNIFQRQQLADKGYEQNVIDELYPQMSTDYVNTRTDLINQVAQPYEKQYTQKTNGITGNAQAKLDNMARVRELLPRLSEISRKWSALTNNGTSPKDALNVTAKREAQDLAMEYNDLVKLIGSYGYKLRASDNDILRMMREYTLYDKDADEERKFEQTKANDRLKNMNDIIEKVLPKSSIDKMDKANEQITKILNILKNPSVQGIKAVLKTLIQAIDNSVVMPSEFEGAGIKGMFEFFRKTASQLENSTDITDGQINDIINETQNMIKSYYDNYNRFISTKSNRIKH